METMIEVRDVSMRFRMANDRISSIKAVSYTHLDVYKRQHTSGKVLIFGDIPIDVPSLSLSPAAHIPVLP